ncbi:MAG: hypothetical protein LUF87_03875 [Alistipes sp.]|nr:hypothetical protein [Alistipes sp.]
MKIPRLMAVAAVLLCVLQSCIKADDIRVVEVEKWGMESLTKPVITLRVRNDSRRNIEILSGRFSLYGPSGKVCDVLLTGEVFIPKRSETSVDLPLRVRLSDPFAAASVFSSSGAASRLTVTGQAEVKAGNARRNFALEGAPVSRFLSIFGADETIDPIGYE